MTDKYAQSVAGGKIKCTVICEKRALHVMYKHVFTPPTPAWQGVRVINIIYEKVDILPELKLNGGASIFYERVHIIWF